MESLRGWLLFKLSSKEGTNPFCPKSGGAYNYNYLMGVSADLGDSLMKSFLLLFGVNHT
jgi:hypothetical protein